jgi:pyruvate-formate lyase-activating enzyme
MDGSSYYHDVHQSFEQWSNYGALAKYSRSMSVAEVWDAVSRDKIFYESSGGGVTVPEGEPLLWAEFLLELPELRSSCRTAL